MTDAADHPAYGLVQLRDLDDAAVAGGFDETMEARFADEALGSTQMGASRPTPTGLELLVVRAHDAGDSDDSAFAELQWPSP